MVPNFKKKLFIELSIMLGVVVIMGGALFYFARSLVTNSVAVVDARKTFISRSHSLESFANLRIAWNDKGKDYLEHLQNTAPLKDQLITLGKDFQFLAGRAGLEFFYVLVGESPPVPPNLGFIQFRISVGGGFSVIQKYIMTLQSFHYLTSVDGITLTRSGNNFEGVILGRTFYR